MAIVLETVLDRALARWRDAGLLDEAQVAAIRAHEASLVPIDEAPPPVPVEPAAPPVPTGGSSNFIVEGLAYVGAALAFGAAFVVLGDVWDDLTAGARLALAVVGTLIVGGAGVTLRTHASGPLHRLSTLLGALAAAGVTASTAIYLSEFTDIDEGGLAALAGGAGFVVAVVLQRLRPSWPVTIVLGGTLLMTVFGTETVLDLEGEAFAGVTLMGLGLAWAALGWTGWLRPQAAFEISGLLAGGVGLQLLSIDSFPWGALLVGVLLSVAVLAIGLTEERTAPAVLGGLGLTVFSPQLVVEVFGESVGGPLALFVGGLILVTVAVMILRQRSE